MNEQLEDYINAQRKAGVSDDAIRQSLLHAGWQLEIINSALGVNDAPAPITSITPPSKLQTKSTVIQPSSGFVDEFKRQKDQVEIGPNRIKPKVELSENRPEVSQSIEQPPGLAVLDGDTQQSQEPTSQVMFSNKSTSSDAFVGGSVTASDAQAIMDEQTVYLSDPFAVMALNWRYTKSYFVKFLCISLIATIALSLLFYFSYTNLLGALLRAAFGGGISNLLINLFIVEVIFASINSLAVSLLAYFATHKMLSKPIPNSLKSIGHFGLFSLFATLFFYLLSLLVTWVEGLLEPSLGSSIISVCFLVSSLYLLYRFTLYFTLLPFYLLESGNSYVSGLRKITKITRKRRRELFGYLSLSTLICTILVLFLTVMPYEKVLPQVTSTGFQFELILIAYIALFILPFILICYFFVAGWGYRYFAYRQLEEGQVESPVVSIVNIVTIGVTSLVIIGAALFLRNYQREPAYLGSSGSYELNETFSSSSRDASSKQSRDLERTIDINALHASLELYYADNGYYPFTLNELSVNKDNLKDPDGFGYSYFPSNEAGGFCFDDSNACMHYELYAYMETDQDGDGDVDFDDVFKRESLN